MRTLFYHNTGPLIQYRAGNLRISDLNPEMEVNWRFSRWELFKLAFKAILAAIAPVSR